MVNIMSHNLWPKSTTLDIIYSKQSIIFTCILCTYSMCSCSRADKTKREADNTHPIV